MLLVARQESRYVIFCHKIWLSPFIIVTNRPSLSPKAIELPFGSSQLHNKESRIMGGDSTATPAQIAAWEAEPLLPPESFADKFRAVKNYFGRGPKAFMFGSYSYSYLCMPTFLPWKKGGSTVSIKHLDFSVTVV